MMDWKRFVRKLSRPNFKVLSRHSPGGTEINPENLSQDSWFSDRDMNSECPEYEAEMLTTRLWSSVKRMKKEYLIKKNIVFRNIMK
jgi:hypothetical protein